MKNSPRRLALALVAASLSAASAASAQTFFAPTLMFSGVRPSKLRAISSAVSTPTLGAVPPRVASAACAPLREVPLARGAASITLAPVAANACAPAGSVARASTGQETVRLRVATRSAVMLSSDGALQLFDAQGAAAVMQTAVGACGAGVHVATAILGAGEYLLRAPGSAPGARAVQVETIPLAAGGVVEAAGARATSLSTGGEGGGVCSRDEGVDVRVLACPGRSVELRAERGAVVALEGASGGRVCIGAPAGVPVTAAAPAGRLLLVRAFPMGASRGAVRVSLR